MLTFDTAGVAIPKLGLGTFTLKGEDCAEIVAKALEVGFRHIDTAESYENEDAVGRGLRASGVSREDVFVTSKVWFDHLKPDDMQRAAEASLKRLGLDRLDLYLIHWPSREVPVREAVRTLNGLLRQGLTRAIGISNHTVTMVEEAVAASEAPLAVNQVEYHPYLDQSKLLAALRRHGMGLTAYAPIAKGTVTGDRVIRRIAERHGASPVQVTLAWLMAQDGVLAIPRTSKPERLAENLRAQDVALSEAEIGEISALARPDGRRISPSFAPDWDD